MQIESYRTRLEDFEQNLNRELYRYHSGQKRQLELVSLYADYSDLFCTESIHEIESALKAEPFESRRKSLEKILLFLMDQYLEFHTAPLQEEISRLEAKQMTIWEGKEVHVSRLAGFLRTESDALKRRKISERQGKALEESEELKQRSIAQLRSSAVSLGFKNHVEAMERISGVHYEKLLSSFEEALRGLEDKFLERFRLSLEASLGIPFQDSGSWDVARWEEKNDEPAVFNERDLFGVVNATILEMEIQPEQEVAVSVEPDRQSRQRSQAFCIPIRIPQEIKIVIAPEQGVRSYAALLHESGHAYPFAWTSPSLQPEHRLLGDRAVSETYAFLLEHLLQEPEWLARKLLFTKSGNYLRFQALHRIFLIRRCVGKLRFAIQLHQHASFDDAPQIYSETMRMYTGLQHSGALWSADFRDGFTSADYLRGWALEAILREHLRVKYGNSWSSNRAASRFLKEIWETGLLYRADELAREIGSGELDPQPLAAQLREGLQY